MPYEIPAPMLAKSVPSRCPTPRRRPAGSATSRSGTGSGRSISWDGGERRVSAPRREAADTLLPRAARGVRAGAPRAVSARRRDRGAGRPRRAAPARLGVAVAAHPPCGIPGQHARRADAGDVHRVRPARRRRPRPAGRAVRHTTRDARGPAARRARPGAMSPHDRRSRPRPSLARRVGRCRAGRRRRETARPAVRAGKRTMFRSSTPAPADVVALGYRISASQPPGGRLAAGRAVRRGRHPLSRRRRGGVEQRAPPGAESTSSRRWCSGTPTGRR